MAFVVGFIFSLGLGISGMARPDKVIGFLDISGNWDPSLMFVMVGAILVHSLSYRFMKKRSSPILAAQFQVPTKKNINPALIIGSILFGIGWGLGGVCPGPAFTALATLSPNMILFVVSLIAGMGLFKILEPKLPFKK